MTGFLNFQRASEYIGRSPRWLRQHINEIPHYKPGTGVQILFLVEDLKTYMDRFRVEPQNIDIRAIVDRVVRPPGRRGAKGRFKSGEGE